MIIKMVNCSFVSSENVNNNASTGDGKKIEQYLWLFGVLAAISASTLRAFGNVVQKLAHDEQLERKKLGQARMEPVPGIIISWKWVLGFVMIAIIPVPLDMLSFSLAAQSLISPLGGINLVLTQIIAPRFLTREVVTRLDYFAGATIFFGVALTSAFGTHASEEYDMQDLKNLWQVPATEAVISFAIISIIVCLVIFHAPNLRNAVPTVVLPIIIAYIAAAIGSLMNILFKGVSELIYDSMTGSPGLGQNVMSSILWVIATIFLAVAQVSYLNQGLQRYPCVLFIPLYTALFILCGVVYGGTYYQEFLCFTPSNWASFTVGVFVSVGGIYLFMHGKSERDTKMMTEDDSEESDNDTEMANVHQTKPVANQ